MLVKTVHIKKITAIPAEHATWGPSTVKPKKKSWQNVTVAAIWLSSRLVVINEQFSYAHAYLGAVRYTDTFPY